MSRLWQRWESELVRELYPHVPTFMLAAELKRPVRQVYQKAERLGLAKTERYLASKWACRLRRDNPAGVAHRFQKGQTPPNKGLRRPGWAPGRMAQTQFKKGQRPHTWVPVGTERLDPDGVLVRKVSDTGNRRIDWQTVQSLLWVEHFGPIPAGHFVRLKDRSLPVAVENLELVSRAYNMRLNSVHNLPKPIALAVQLLGAVNRQINQRARA